MLKLESSVELTRNDPRTHSHIALCLIQLYPVEDILNNCCRDNRGPLLVERLKQSQPMSRSDRMFLVKVLGKYLMKHCRV